MRAVTENTKISLGILVVLVGGIAWLTSLHAVAESTARSVQEMQSKQEKYSEDLSEIKTDIAVIKKILEEN